MSVSEPSVSGLPVLVVDDDASLLDLLAFSVESAGYMAHLAGDRPSALLRARELSELRIALIDLGLPPHANEVSEGITLLEQLQILRPGIKVIVITGQDQDAAALAAIRAGAFDFLGKPVSGSQIIASLHRAALFVRKEAALRDAGESRITIAARIEEGIKEAGEAAEERLLRQILADTGFNVTECARRLGVQRENIYYFIKKYGIQRDA